MGQLQKNLLSFCNILVYVEVYSFGLGIYMQPRQTCLLLKGCPGQSAGSELELIAVEKIVHSEGWIPGIQTQRIHVIGATPLKKHHHQKKMNLMSNVIKSNASLHSVCCLWGVMFSLCASAIYGVNGVE